MKTWNPQIPDSVGEERWNQFEHTGRVEDYLNYVKARAAARREGGTRCGPRRMG